MHESREIEELRREVQRLRELQRSRADSVANLTHQLKSPLTSLLGYAMILRTRDASITAEQRTEFLSVIETQGERILTLIEDLLASSRIEEHSGTLQRVPVDLPAIARRVADEMGFGRGRSVQVIAPADDLGLYGDPAAMEHVLTNLIDNALKYSPAHEAVLVRITQREGEVMLVVQDHGKGIPEDEVAFVFDRFRQASNAHGRGSVGLGLYIVKTLVEAHGGRVRAESASGEGTTISVTLPRRRAR